MYSNNGEKNERKYEKKTEDTMVEQKESGAYNGKNSENSGIENGKDNSKKRKEWHWPDSVWANRNHPSVTACAAGDSFYCVQQTATAYNLCLLAVCPALRADSDTDYQPTGKSGV